MGLQIVNVIFYGVFGYVLGPDCIDVYTPAVSDHIYKAGKIDYHHCDHLKRTHTYQLCGVHGDPSNQPDPGSADYPMVSIAKGDFGIVDQFDKKFCRFLLPYPSKIDTYKIQIFPVDTYNTGPIFAGQHAKSLNALKRLASVLIFVYQRNDDKLQLASVSGNHSLDFSDLPETSVPGIVNAHIWCTRTEINMQGKPLLMGGMSPEAHMRRAFPAMVDFFPALELTMNIPDNFSPPAADMDADWPAGVTKDDIDPGVPSLQAGQKVHPMFGKTNCHFSSLMISRGD